MHNLFSLHNDYSPHFGSSSPLLIIIFHFLILPTSAQSGNDHLCAENICQNGGTCFRVEVDGNDDSFICQCRAGFSGALCEAFDSSVPTTNTCTKPCANNGRCELTEHDEHCSCAEGYYGDLCEIVDCEIKSCAENEICLFNIKSLRFACEINFCHLKHPCHNNVTCRPAKDDYFCECPLDWGGKDCDLPVNECSRCKNNSTCINNGSKISCKCATGYKDKYCDETSFCNETSCSGHGICHELSSDYECRCFPSFSGPNCQFTNNDQKVRNKGESNCGGNRTNKLLENGDVVCVCNEGLTGENCDISPSSTIVPNTKTGSGTEMTCEELHCEDKNNLICRTRIRQFSSSIPTNLKTSNIVENYCDCPIGWMGDQCKTPTVVTLNAESAVLVDRPLTPTSALPSLKSNIEYRLEFSFRTTLPIVVFASGESILGANDFSFGLNSGYIQLNISAANGTLSWKLDGTPLLNDAEWHRIRLINSPLGECFVELEDEQSGRVLWQQSLGSFRPFHRIFTTRFGSKGDGAFYTGCLRDVKIDSQAVDLMSQTRSVGVTMGCERHPQCGGTSLALVNASDSLQPCANDGRCVDLWNDFRCDCVRPFIGVRCTEIITEITFGHGKRASQAQFALNTDEINRIRDETDVSFFMRTNAAPAVLFYIGESVDSVSDEGTNHFIGAELLSEGKLQIDARIGNAQIIRNHSSISFNDNVPHFVRILRQQNNITMFVDGKINAQVNIGRIVHGAPLFAEELLVGNWPHNTSAAVFETEAYFRGTLQDLRVNDRAAPFSDFNGLPLSLHDVDKNGLHFFGKQINAENLLKGTVSDDVCAETQPCRNDARCLNTFNDFRCECKPGWIGSQCDERDYCKSSPCRATATCVNVDGGYICMAPATFTPTSTAKFSLITLSQASLPPQHNNFTFEVRTRSTAPAVILEFLTSSESLRLELDAKGTLLFSYQNTSLEANNGVQINARNQSSTGMTINDGDWHVIAINDDAAGLHCTVDGTNATQLLLPFSLASFLLYPNAEIHFGRLEGRASFKGCVQHAKLGTLAPLTFLRGVEGAGGFNSTHTRFDLTNVENVRADGCHSDQLCFENEENECRNWAKCEDRFNERRCICPPGFDGDLCELNIDECAPKPGEPAEAKCGINGICVDGIANYTCTCLPGFSGERCDVPMENFCETRYKNACLNGGRCERDSVGNYKCICAPNHVGQYCQTEKNTKCSRAPCKNNGKCTQTENGFTCACMAGFTGTLCDIEVAASGDPCRQRPCQNGGHCRSTPTGQQSNGVVAFSKFAVDAFTCECRPQFVGARCERFADACASTTTILVDEESDESSDNNATSSSSLAQPCRNGALCENVFGGRVCHCTSGWRGDDCAVDVDECAELGPCFNGAQCRNTAGSFECHCPQFYFGKHCELQGACARQPCKNGAVCEQISAHEHVCHCAPGYRGDSCEMEIDFCATAPCKNGATCRRVVAGFECTCAPGFSGKTCENDIDECALAPNSCANNGTCVDRVNAYECDCRGTGYQGPQCLDDVDECAESHSSNRDDIDNDENFKPWTRPKSSLWRENNTENSESSCVHGICTNLPGSYRCDCEPGYIGARCHMINPCLPEPRTQRILHACTHGKCVRPKVVRQPSGRDVTQHDCECDPGYGGAQCTFLEQAKTPLAIGYILGPFAVVLVILCAFSTMLFFLVIRKKRAMQGTYSPSTQEMTGGVRPSPPLHAHVTHSGVAVKTNSAKNIRAR